MQSWLDKDSTVGILINHTLLMVTSSVSALGVFSTTYVDLITELVKNMVFISIGILGLLFQYWINYDKIKKGQVDSWKAFKSMFKFKKKSDEKNIN